MRHCMTDLPIIIPTVDPECPAALALRMEGLDPRVVIMEDDYSYANLLVKYWKDKTGFVLVEQDIVPWPSAIASLQKCEQDFCAYSYPHGSDGGMTRTLGCIKISTKFVVTHPNLYNEWIDCLWQNVQVYFLEPVRTHHTEEDCHEHFPPVAHVKKNS